MRSVINISLPPKMAKKVKQEVQVGDYSTVSEYFRDLLREHEDRRVTRKSATARQITAYIKAYTKYPESSVESATLTKLIPQVLSHEDWR